MRRTMWAALAALLAFGANAHADNFPSHPITMVVPFSAAVQPMRWREFCRADAHDSRPDHPDREMSPAPVVRWASDGSSAAAPDGYTISIGHLGTHVANGAVYKLGYDLVTDLEPVVMLPSNPMVIVSRNTVPRRHCRNCWPG